MHRHGYKGRKFGRKTDQATALVRGLMCSLIKYQSITTTLARAKEMRRSTEKLITLAEYVNAMPEGQEKIYYACAETAKRAAALPQAETV